MRRKRPWSLPQRPNLLYLTGPVSKSPDFLFDMIDAGMDIARMNFSHGSHEYHGETIANCREAAERFKREKGFDPCLAIALDTKGPEIRSGMLEGDDGRKEIILEAGNKIKLTTDDAFKDKCTADTVWVDYKNITKVLEPGKRIFIDDGLISVVAKEIGNVKSQSPSCSVVLELTSTLPQEMTLSLERSRTGATLVPERAVTSREPTQISQLFLRRTRKICSLAWNKEWTSFSPPSSATLLASGRSERSWATRARTS